MTTPPAEPDPYAGSDGSDQDDRDWAVRPAVPGWSAGQHFYTGPVFDDTGWHIDLSGVDWGQEPEPDDDDDEPPRQRERSGRRRSTVRFRNQGPPAGNGYAPPPGPADATQRNAQPPALDGTQPGYADYDHRPDPPATRRGRPSGRHARPPEPDEQRQQGPATALRRVAPLPGTTTPRPGVPPPPPGRLPPLPSEQARPGGRRASGGSVPGQVLPG
ncbi:MAG: hypothetical protein ACRDOK_04825, partial [Streptosporangiaceae bacterium]